MKLFIPVLTLFILLYTGTYAHPAKDSKELDSLYYRYISLKSRVLPGMVNDKGIPKIQSAADEPLKCATGLVHEVKKSFQLFSADKKAMLKKLDGRPTNTDTSFTTPGGHFRIHAIKDPSKSPKYSIPDFIAALDSVYEIEINKLGFPPPPGDNGAGGDNLYDIYIIDLAGQYYGYTETETSVTSQTSTTYMVIDNDYSASDRYSILGLNGARITAAHEFNHAIQMGNYNDYYSSAAYFYEMTSEAIEYLVFSYIPGYLVDCKDYFRAPDKAFYKHDGYDLAIWNIFLAEKFGPGIMKRQWELFASSSALRSIEQSLNENQSSFLKAYSEFALWTYYTNYRAIAGKYFKAASNMPLLTKTYSSAFTPPRESVTLSTAPISNSYVLFSASSASGIPDSLAAIITCTDVNMAEAAPDGLISAQYSLYNSNDTGCKPFTGNYYYSLSVPSEAVFSISKLFNNRLATDTLLANTEAESAFPAPFHYARHSVINLPVASGLTSQADYYIYTPSMHLVCKGNGSIKINQNKYILQWNGLTENGEKLNNGIYIAVTDHDENIKKCKIVVFND